MFRKTWLFLVAMTLIGCKPSSSGTCSESWTAVRGTQEADDGGGCGAFVGTSVEVNPSFDWWGAQFDQKTQPKGTALKIEVTFSRPVEDSDRPVDLHFRGGYFGVAQDKYYFWEGDSEPPVAQPNPHWTAWQQTKVDIRQETTIAVRQKGAELEGYINGALVGTFKLNAAPVAGPVGVGFKSAKGKTAKVRIRDFSVTEL